MSTDTKDTIYIDVDDEITGIIDKVRGSKHKIIALVLPKRAATLQSIVNMKLLKRTATEANKRLVLITSETGLLPLAGAVGMYVAKNLQSKPGIPPSPEVGESETESIVSENDSADTELDPSRSVGELAGLPTQPVEDTIEVDNSESAVAAVPPVKTPKANKKLKIPNFERFRLRLFLAVAALIILVVGWYVCFMVLPKARVTIQTDTSTITSNLKLNLSASAKQLDSTKLIVPADLKEIKKTDTEKVSATGQKDQGTKASGTVTISNCGASPVTVPAGTGISANNLTFITQTALSLTDGNFDASHNCKSSGSHVGSVGVTAQQNGDQYNLAARSDYKVAGFSSLSGTGTAMSGGTSNLVKVISDADIDTAKQKLANRSTQAATDELKKALQADGQIVIPDSLLVGTPVITSVPNVGDEATDVTVTQVITYDMVGVKQDDLKKLVDSDAKKQIDPAEQTLLDEGLAQAVFHVQDRKSPGELQISMQTSVTAGPELIPADLQKQIAGKKRGEATALIQNRPGVKSVTITYSPFWVSSTPKKSAKITIVTDQNNAQTKPTTKAQP